MGRPQKQTVDYFPHDAHASQGDTLTILQGKWGNDGYAFWFRLLEKLCSSREHFIDCRNPVKWQLLLAQTQLNNGTGEEIMETLVGLEAVDAKLWKEHRIIWCQNLVDNLTDAYRNRKRTVPVKPIPTVIYPVSTASKPQIKEKERKGNKKKVYGEFKNVLLTDEDYKKLLDRFGEGKTKRLIENLSVGIADKGYKRSNHYATIISWEKRDAGTHRENIRAVRKPGEFTKAPADLELD